MEDSKKWLYDNLSKSGYDLGNYNEYNSNLSDEDTQKWLYDSAIKTGLDVGSFEEFTTGMGFNNSKIPDTLDIGGDSFSKVNLLKPKDYSAQSDGIKPTVPLNHTEPINSKNETNPSRIYNAMEDQILDKIQNPELNQKNEYSDKAKVPANSEVAAKYPFSLEGLENRLKNAPTITKPKYNSYEDIHDKYFSRFSMTLDGETAQQELSDINAKLINILFSNLKESKEYKDIINSTAIPEDKDVAIQKLWDIQYKPQLERQMQPYMEEYNQKVFARYGKQMNEDALTFNKESTRNSWFSLENRIAEYEANIQDRRRNSYLSAAPTYESHFSKIQREDNSQDIRKKDTQISAARSMMESSKKIIEAANAEADGTFIEGVARGFKDEAFNIDNWTMGLKGLADGQACLNVLEKYEKGGKLTKEEELLMDAMVSNAATQAYFQSELGRGYKAGSVTGASLPFMVDMLTGVAAVSAGTKTATKGLMKWIAKKYTKNNIQKNIAKGITGLSKGVVDSAIHTATFGAGRVANDYTQREIGQVNVDMKNGPTYDGREGAENGLGTLGKSFVATGIETQSELLGSQFAPILGFVGKQMMRIPGIRNIPASEAGKWMKEVYNSASVKGVREFANKAQFHGPVSEYTEEVYNNLGSVAIGDMTPEQLVDLDQNIDTFLGVSIMSSIFGIVGGGSYIREKYITSKRIRDFENKMKVHIPNFDEFKTSLKEQDIQGARTFVKEVMADNSLSPQEKREEMEYIVNVLKESAMNSAEKENGKEALPIDYIEENKATISSEFEITRKNLENKLPPAIIKQIDAGENIDAVMFSNGISEEQRDAIIDYHAAKSDFEDYLNTVREKVSTAKINARKDVEGISNPEMGAVIRVTRRGSETPIHIVGGHISFAENGFIDKQNSSDILYYVDENGKRLQASPSDFEKLVDMNDTESVASQAEEDAESQAIEEEQAQLPQVQEPEQGTVFKGVDGKTYSVNGKTADGYIIDTIDDNGNLSGTQQWTPEMLSSMYHNNPTQPIAETSITNATPPKSDDVDKISNVQDDVNKVATVSKIPTNEKGEPVYHKANIEDTILDLSDGALNDSEIDDFISTHRKDANNKIAKLQNKPPKMGLNKISYLEEKKAWEAKITEEQQRIDYWNEVEKQIKESRTAPGDQTANEIMTFDQALDGEELAAQLLANGNIKLLQDSFSRETGFGQNEIKKYFGLFSGKDKGGMTIEEAGEALMQADLENGTNFFDQSDPNAGRNAIIDVLAKASTKGELAKLIRDNREQLAERERRAEYEKYERWCDENFHMTPEEYEIYEEQALPTIIEKYQGFDELEFYSNIADDLKQIDDDTTREIAATSSGNEILQGKEPVPTGRTGTGTNERTEVSTGLQSSVTDGNVQESTNGGKKQDSRLRQDGAEQYSGKIVQEIANGMDVSGESVAGQRIGGNGTVPEPVPQREFGTETPQNERMEEAAAGLRSRIEAATRYAQEASRVISGKERQIAEQAFVALSINPNENVLDYASRIVHEKEMYDIRQSIDTNPTDAQKKAGNYQKGHIRFDGYDITIENPKGSERSGVDAEGRSWSVRMNNDYGYIRGTEGVDGDHIDVFLSDNPAQGNVYVVDQLDTRTGGFDEHKVMYGFASVDEAKEAYLANYSPGWKGLGNITGISKEVFKEWIDSSHRKTKPFAEYKGVKNIGTQDNIRFREVNSLEEQTIIDEAKKDGSYMKAPNGKPTNLNEKQWVQVRTKAFKEWFGNWEKVARINKLHSSKPVEITGNEIARSEDLKQYRKNANEYGLTNLRGEYTNKDTGKVISVSKSSIKEITSHDASSIQFQSVAAIPQILENGIYIDRINNEDIGKHGDISSYDYYLCGLRINGVDYTVKAVVANSFNGERYYDHRLTEIEKGKLISLTTAMQNHGSESNTPLSDFKDKRLLSILQTNSSKVVDENGEPMVVYHGTLAKGLTHFDKNKIGSRYSYDESGFFFTDKENIAKDYSTSEFDSTVKGEIVPVFLNARKPIAADNKWAVKNGLGNVLKNMDSIEFWDNYQSFMLDEIEDKKSDGAIINDGYSKMVIVFEPNQIKSATGNTGTFSSFNDDIRFREANNEEITSFAKKYNLDETDVRKYAQCINMRNLGGATYAFNSIKRSVRLSSIDLSLGEFVKVFSPIKLELYERYGDVDALRDEYVQREMEQRNVMEAARKRAEEEAEIERQRLQEFELMTDEEMDAAYFKAMEENDEARMRDIVNESARRNGYVSADEFRMAHRAPSYDEEGIDKSMVDIAANKDSIRESLNEQLRMNRDKYKDESAAAINAALSDIDKGEKPTVTIYRAVPKSLKEGKVRNGDWVSLSESYVKVHGEHALNGNYRIMKEEVPAENLYWDGNDINEWGYDDRSDYRYKNTRNNRKLNDLITRDDKGNLIPPSRRFNARKADARFRETDEANRKFNEQLQQQIDGTLPKGHVYQLGNPSKELLSAGIPDLPIEMASARLLHKSNQENHPFDLSEVENLPTAVQSPLAVFRSATHIGSNVILTELKHGNKNFVVAILTNKEKGKILINDIRSIHPRTTTNIVDWINNGLMDYADKEKMSEWVSDKIKSRSHLNSSNPAEVKRQLDSATKIVESFENPTLEQGKILSSIDNLSESLHTPVRVIRDVNEITDNNSKTEQRKRKAKGWFDPKTGEVVFILPNAYSVEDARETIFHEVVAHYGLRRMFGEDFDTFLDNVYANATDNIREEIESRGGDTRIATEEYLAELAEKGFENDQERSLWQKIKDAFIIMLRKAGVDLGFRLTDNELRYILWRSHENLQQENILATAKDIAMQYELKVGDYREGTKDKINRNYDRTINAVNSFTTQKQGAGNVLVIKSKDTLRTQLMAIGVSNNDISKYEHWMSQGSTPAFFTPKYGNRIIVLDTNVSDKELNSYLWHENVHKALNDLDDGDHLINVISEFVKKNVPNTYDRVASLYNKDGENCIKEECVAFFIEDLLDNGKEDKMLSGDVRLKNKEVNNAICKILNSINHGTENENSGNGFGDLRGRRTGNNHEKGSAGMEMRNSNDNGRYSKGSERGRNEQQRIFEEETRRISDRNGSKVKGVGDNSGGVREVYSGRNPKDASGKQHDERVRFREEESDPSDNSRKLYEQSLGGKKYKFLEAYQDSMIALKMLQDVIAKVSGKPIQTFEDAYMAENHMSSKSTAEAEKYYDNYFEPLEREISHLIQKGASYENISDYIILKHGIERNIEFSVRDAIQSIEKDKGREFADNIRRQYEEDKAAIKEMFSSGKIDSPSYLQQLENLAMKYAGSINDYSATRTMLGKLTGQVLPNKVGDKDQTEAYINLYIEKYGENSNPQSIAKEKVKEFEEHYNTKPLWEKINAASKQTLKKSYESGMMSKASYEHKKSMFSFYVPLRGWDETTADDVYEYLSSEVSPVNSVLKQAKGRKSIPDNPIPVIGNMAESTILQGNRNLMKQAFMNMVMNHPTDVATLKHAWYVEDPSSGEWVMSFPQINNTDSTEEVTRKMREHEERMKELEKEGKATRKAKGLNINYKISNAHAQEHIVSVKRNGQDYMIFINGNPRAAQAINGLTNPDVEKNSLFKAMGKANRWLAANFTTRNPAFVLSNLSRDLIFAQSAVMVKESPEYAGKFLVNVPKAMKAIMRNLSGGGNVDSEIDKYFNEFIENGGETGYMTLTDVDKYKKKIKRDLEQLTGKEGTAKKALRWSVDRLEDFNRWAEDVSRFTTYMTSRQMGRSVVESINDAKEITVNFNKKGAGYKTGGFFGISAGLMKNLYLFFNAGIQSLANFEKLAKKNPTKFGIMLSGFTAAGFIIPSMVNPILYAYSGYEGDDDPYQDLPEWVRRNNLCLYCGGGKFVTIPLPIELRAFYGLGDIVFQYTTTKGKIKPFEIIKDVTNQLTELLPLNPLGNNGDLISTLMPDALKPFWQINQNKDFTGKPIYKNTAFNELDPEFKRVYKGTSGWLVDSSQFLNEISGGSDFRKGWMDINPAQVEHLYEAYFGGMGKTLNQFAKTIWYGGKSLKTGEMDENLQLRNAPVVNRFINSVDERSAFAGINKEYFRLVDEFDLMEHEYNGLSQKASLINPKYLNEFIRFTNSTRFIQYKTFKELKDHIDKMYKVAKTIPNDEARKKIEADILEGKRRAIAIMEESSNSTTTK